MNKTSKVKLVQFVKNRSFQNLLKFMNLVVFLGRFASNFLAFLMTVSVGVLEHTEILIE